MDEKSTVVIQNIYGNESRISGRDFSESNIDAENQNLKEELYKAKLQATLERERAEKLKKDLIRAKRQIVVEQKKVSELERVSIWAKEQITIWKVLFKTACR